jgi:hypothetical protein
VVCSDTLTEDEDEDDKPVVVSGLAGLLGFGSGESFLVRVDSSRR